MKARSFSKKGFAVALFWTALTIAVSAQTLNTLANFNKADGDNPTFLVQGTDGNFYGAAYYGGNSSNCPLASGAAHSSE